MRRKTVVIPMHRKKKLGTNAARAKGKFVTSMAATQFAVEQLAKRVAAPEKQCDGLAKLDKEKDFHLNRQDITIKRLQERIQRRDSE